MRSAKILVVDDEAESRTALGELLRIKGYAVETAASGFKALPKLEALTPDILLVDLRMPGMDGLELTHRALELDPSCIVLVTTAFGSIESAISVIRAGASDFLNKPIDVDHLFEVIARELARHPRTGPRSIRPRTSLPGAVGSSDAMQRVAELVRRVAPSRASVLITGETGTGKGLVAQALHALGPRAHGPFVQLQCASLAEGVLESELFGHEKSAFTGATGRRAGRFEQAHGGTLFLDEIGEISPAIQVKLLRVLQERELERVGGNETVRVDVRLIAATHRDIRRAVAEGRFREDLYYRLKVVEIHLPSLRERREDLPALAAHFVRHHAAVNERPIAGITDEALRVLAHHDWPGNVRELEHTIERAVVLCHGDHIDVADLSLPPHRIDDRPAIPGSTLEELERDAILRTLEHTGGSTARAAAILGVSPRMLQYRLRTWARDAVTRVR